MGVPISPDGYTNLRMVGKLSAVKFRAAQSCGGVSTPGIGDNGAPSLTGNSAREVPRIELNSGGEDEVEEPEPIEIVPDEPPPAEIPSTEPDIDGAGGAGASMGEGERLVPPRRDDDVAPADLDPGDEPRAGEVPPPRSGEPPNDDDSVENDRRLEEIPPADSDYENQATGYEGEDL